MFQKLFFTIKFSIVLFYSLLRATFNQFLIFRSVFFKILIAENEIVDIDFKFRKKWKRIFE